MGGGRKESFKVVDVWGGDDDEAAVFTSSHTDTAHTHTQRKRARRAREEGMLLETKKETCSESLFYCINKTFFLIRPERFLFGL